jgi:hypothetical protein
MSGTPGGKTVPFRSVWLRVSVVGLGLIAAWLAFIVFSGASTAPPSKAPTAPHEAKWTSSDPHGGTDMYDASGQMFQMQNNEWNTDAKSLGTQSIWASSPSDWGVTANFRAGTTQVLTYPDAQYLYYNTQEVSPALSSFTSITSSWTESQPTSSGYIGEAAYDIWLNSWNTEVMIWVDNHGQDHGSDRVASTTISGYGLTLYMYYSERIVTLNTNHSSGSIDVLAVLNWLRSGGYIPSSSTLTAIDFGWEICSTGGVPGSFQVSSYSLSSKS